MLFALPFIGHAQHSHHHDHQVISHIEQQVEAGDISYEEGLLQRFRAAYGKRVQLQGDLQVMSTDQQMTSSPYRCLTPIIAEFERNRSSLSAGAEEEISNMITHRSSRVQSTYTSPSEVFRLHYSTSGDDAVDTTDTSDTGIPDYIERAAEIADSSYQVLVEEYGFEDPRYYTDEPYDIYFKDLNDGVYGLTRSISAENTTEIEVRNSYEGFPDNDDPEGNEIGALKVTLAHELQHAIQYRYTRWSGPSGEFDWIEMDAVMIEEIVFPYVNDYHNYLTSINSIFSRPHEGAPGAYWQATWSLYYYEQFGGVFWREVWEHLQADVDRTVPEAKSLAKESEISLAEERVRNHLWHLSAGEFSLEEYGFIDRHAYPKAKLTEESDIPKGLRSAFMLRDYDARYYRYTPDEGSQGPLHLGVFADGNGLSYGLLGVTPDGDYKEQIIIPSDEDRPDLIDTGWDVSDFEEIRLVITGSIEGGEGRFRFLVGTGDDIESVPYGDFNEDEAVNEDDVRQILDQVAQQNSGYSSERLRGDVSGDGSLSAYDGSLILKFVDGNLDNFPVDESGTGYGPEVSRFTSGYGTDADRVNPEANPDVAWTLELITDKPKTKHDLDISVKLEVGDDSPVDEFHSLYLELEVPEGITFDEIVTGSSLDQAIWKYHRDEENLYLAVSGRHSFAEDTLFTMTFEPEEDQEAEIKIVQARLDEYALMPYSAGTGTFEIEDSVPVGSDEDPEVPEELVLKQNYPNPFNPVTIIEFELPESGNSQLVVYDVNGREITTLVDQNLQAGTHQFDFDGSRLSSGMYIYRLYTPAGVKTGKMMLVK